jgi:hypothetical protein
VNTLMNFRVPQKAVSFLASSANISFLTKIMLHVVKGKDKFVPVLN